jgi:hypothetical protein
VSHDRSVRNPFDEKLEAQADDRVKSNYTRLLQQQRDRLTQFKERSRSREVQKRPEFKAKAPAEDSDDELAFMLNSKPKAPIAPASSRIEKQESSKRNEYSQNLLDVIDMMESAELSDRQPGDGANAYQPMHMRY